MISPQLRAAMALLLWAIAAGCDGFPSQILPDKDGGSSDRGTGDAGIPDRADAAGAIDAGHAFDASQGLDASLGRDASQASDASQGPDASAGADAGHADAGTGGDGGLTPLACTDLPLCDDFESVAAGGPPDSKRWTLGAPGCQGTGANGTQIVIDDTEARSGTKSVKVIGKTDYCNHLFLSNSSAVLSLGSNFYARLWVRFSDALGNGHVTFAAMKDATSGKDLRMGGQNGVLMYNREPDDATLPAMSPAGGALSVKPPPREWHCIEFHIDGSQGLLQTWFDGTAVAGLQIDHEPTPDVDEQWLRGTTWRPSLQDFRLGWEGYPGVNTTLWFDDVALGSARIGCQ